MKSPLFSWAMGHVLIFFFYGQNHTWLVRRSGFSFLTNWKYSVLIEMYVCALLMCFPKMGLWYFLLEIQHTSATIYNTEVHKSHFSKLRIMFLVLLFRICMVVKPIIPVKSLFLCLVMPAVSSLQSLQSVVNECWNVEVAFCPFWRRQQKSNRILCWVRKLVCSINCQISFWPTLLHGCTQSCVSTGTLERQ